MDGFSAAVGSWERMQGDVYKAVGLCIQEYGKMCSDGLC